MSAIFGIFNLDGQPVDPQNLNRMKQAMAYWGPDGSGIWSEGPIGLGHLLRHNTPESLYESLPRRDESGTLILTAGARLDNREELFRALNVDPNEQARMTDSALILNAYQKWGTDCPAHLLGDWAFALWDARLRRLFIARDHYGVTGLYYYRDHRRFLFASSLKGLLALPDLPCPLNPAFLAQRGGGFRCDASTPYEGIRLLTPAQAMTVTVDKADLWHYWHPQNVPDIRFGSDQDYLDAFMDVYSEAVRCRLRSHRPIGVMLSGGLDSGSISILAARELAQRGQRLFAFSSIPAYDTTETTTKNRCGDERPYIEATCRFADNIDLTYIKAEKITPLAAFDRALAIHDRPHGNANYNWILKLLETAQRPQIGTMLDGWGGNFTISWTGNREKYLLTLLKAGEWGTFVREVKAWRNLHHVSLWRAVASQVVKPFVPPIWHKRIQHFRRSGHRRLINKAAIQSIVQNHQVMKIDDEATNSLNPGLYHYFRNGHTAMSFELAATFGLEIRQPAMDKRVIEFCLGIPQDQHTRHGQERLLIRHGMCGLMPESVLWYKRRGIQSADIGQRIRANRAEIETALQKLESSALAQHYLDLPYMAELFQKTLQDKLDPTILTPANRLLRGLIIGLFLQRFEND